MFSWHALKIEHLLIPKASGQDCQHLFWPGNHDVWWELVARLLWTDGLCLHSPLSEHLPHPLPVSTLAQPFPSPTPDPHLSLGLLGAAGLIFLWGGKKTGLSDSCLSAQAPPQIFL